MSFRVGERVRVLEGPFEDFLGIIEGLDPNRERVKILVNFFGRQMPVELDYNQVERA